MTPKAQAFKEANDKSPVYAGRAIEPNPNKPAKGGVYTLEDESSWRLSVEDLRSLPEGYPKWKL